MRQPIDPPRSGANSPPLSHWPFGFMALLVAALLLSACGKQAVVASPTPAATATLAAAATATTVAPTATPVPPTASATPNAAATAAVQATATANAREAQAVAYLGAGNTLRQAGNLDGAVHDYATARALAPSRPDIASAIATARAMQTATAQPTPTPVVPTKLLIPKLGVSAPIELLGLTSDGAMEAPEGWWDAGWYKYGPLPGQAGNSVIAGHLDSTTGPALFWRLTTLAPGDTLSVALSNGQSEQFVVERQVSYPDNNAPLQQIFGPASTDNLNLITCGGIWNPFVHNYSNRTVVYTQKR